MSDYGHELLFGSFLTPTNAQPDQAVGLAQLSEQVGLDLATFQDHPYQPGFLDTWTLTSFVAAATDRIRLAPNVANLPLRPPAVMARSVASLDLLSGGRIELGLGAGAFWEAIEAMGGRRLTPGEAVAALAEAIDVIRQVWDTEGRGGVRVDGDHYRVVGAKRGPAPAHDIPIWLGAYKPRMLALTGRTADGWLPSLSYLQPGDLATGNRIIDDSASQAGRSPHEIRRLLNVNGEFLTTGRGRLAGPAEQWAEELADFALSDGMSVFIMASDDPDDLRRFAGEVAPGVRELVSAERSSPSAETDPRAGEVVRAVVRAEDWSRPAGSAAPGTPFEVVATFDDGARRSDTRVWDDSTRPSGPTPPTRSGPTGHTSRRPVSSWSTSTTPCGPSWRRCRTSSSR